MPHNFERTIYVYLPCIRAELEEEKTEFVNIEEGPSGEDILTFICPKCGKEHKSPRFG